MPSIFKRRNSPFYFASYRAADGRWLKKSTKTADRTKALQLCVAWDKAAANARRGELTAAQARRVISEMVAVSSGETLQFHTIEGWLTEWLANKSGSAAESTILRYRQVIRDFLDHLGPRASASLAAVSPGDVIAFRDRLRAEGRAASTCNTVVKKVLSVPFEAARKLGFIPTNPVAAVDNLRDRSAQGSREPFSAAEISQLARTAQGDWQGAILLGATSGLRLGDVASLVWSSVDLGAMCLHIQTAKTGARVILPIHPDFERWLHTRPRGIAKAPVFPQLFGKRLGGCRGLSAQFRRIMEEAGVTCRVVEREGKGRATSAKSFHSLRHSFISALANAGVGADIRQKLAGHADAKVHADYTHHELAALRGAVEKITAVSE